MYSIGKFSKITGVSTKTLIWYDSVGLLKPCKVDLENGYRYYDDESLKKLVNIRFWQSMGFSVKEIANLSKEVISNKIDELQTKIDFIASNISFLKHFEEENMDKEKISIFNLEEKLLQGKWRYRKSSTDFNDVIDCYRDGEKDQSMPEYLFFGENNVGTDLKEIFGYSSCFTLIDETKILKNSPYEEEREKANRDFWYFIVNYKSTLVLYEKPKDEKKLEKIKFHIYIKENNTSYSSKDIQTIYEKYCKEIGTKFYEFNKDYVGNYKIYDEILESEINSYSGKIKTVDACFTLDPLFNVLEIKENQDVFVMKVDDVLELTTSNGKKLFNRENTKMTISMDGQRRLGDFYINNFNGKRHNAVYKKVGEDEYIFANLDNNVDLYAEVYVFKKIK